ncbi:MAG: hypothetical protein H0V26_03525 [Solirubrobacterales bacterium]|jgi:hypothetical protein|nr:hypothetical protein [Solirubrobacterales bacterium]MBA3791690.1 hypothetical protein [Rubrobacter sp.]
MIPREFKSGIGSNTPPRAGEEVTVIYDPLLPGEARTTPGSAIRFRPQAFVIAGVLALGLIGFFFLAFMVLVLLVLL